MRAILIFCLLIICFSHAVVVTIQPDPAEGIDTTLKKFMPDLNFGKASGIVIDGSPTLTQVFLLKFDLEHYSYTHINQATLDLYAFAATGNGSIAINRVIASWDEMAATWNNEPPFNPSTITQRVEPMFRWTHINITGMVQYWVNHPYQNFGLRGSPVEKNLIRAFRSSDNNYDPGQNPRLIIDYERIDQAVVPQSLGEVKATFYSH
jgi:hypothetical protein